MALSALCYPPGMTKLQDAAKLLGREGGKKGGKAKVPKGFAKTDAAHAGTMGMLRRWGKQIDLTIEIAYLPSQTTEILNQARRLVTRGFGDPDTVPDYSVADAVADIVWDILERNPVIKRLKLSAFGTQVGAAEEIRNPKLYFGPAIEEKVKKHGAVDNNGSPAATGAGDRRDADSGRDRKKLEDGRHPRQKGVRQ
jgi:hypothetical protein